MSRKVTGVTDATSPPVTSKETPETRLNKGSPQRKQEKQRKQVQTPSKEKASPAKGGASGAYNNNTYIYTQPQGKPAREADSRSSTKTGVTSVSSVTESKKPAVEGLSEEKKSNRCLVTDCSFGVIVPPIIRDELGWVLDQADQEDIPLTITKITKEVNQEYQLRLISLLNKHKILTIHRLFAKMLPNSRGREVMKDPRNGHVLMDFMSQEFKVNLTDLLRKGQIKCRYLKKNPVEDMQMCYWGRILLRDPRFRSCVLMTQETANALKEMK